MLKPAYVEEKVMTKEIWKEYYEEHKYRNLANRRNLNSGWGRRYLHPEFDRFLPSDIRDTKVYARPPIPYCKHCFSVLSEIYSDLINSPTRPIMGLGLFYQKRSLKRRNIFIGIGEKYVEVTWKNGFVSLFHPDCWKEYERELQKQSKLTEEERERYIKAIMEMIRRGWSYNLIVKTLSGDLARPYGKGRYVIIKRLYRSAVNRLSKEESRET